LRNISALDQKFADELKGVVRATLTAAAALSDDSAEKIRTALSKMTGKEVSLTVEQDPSLIGGIVTRIGDLVLDGSIKTQLLNMRESLKRGESV
jgi:F-type H+-transporting ATPase subunit delta